MTIPNNRCLLCCREVAPEDGTQGFHANCSRSLFGTQNLPQLPYAWEDLNNLAKQIVRARVSVPGVQPKLSLHLEQPSGESSRLTLVGLWGDFILKPPHAKYPGMPELEHACMLMAQAAGIDAVPCALMRLKGGELAYLTRRIDRDGGKKLHMEDMCQITGRMTDQKYRGSLEQIGKAVWRYSATPGLDVYRLFLLTLFCYLTGNSDMHLKNFSLLYDHQGQIRLSPAYDLLPTRLLLPQDKEESALTIDGKKSRLRRKDFHTLGRAFGLTTRQIENAFGTIQNSLGKMFDLIEISHVDKGQADKFRVLINERKTQLGV